MRGEPFAPGEELLAVRIIPACAGQTYSPSSASSCPSDHPRVCGANVGVDVPGGREAGSSPRVRGKRPRRRPHHRRHRIIPACAGQTRPAGLNTNPSTDHPRVCGANSGGFGGGGPNPGSSPRVRGKHRRRRHHRLRRRIIPACAGQTTRPASSNPAATDHPRVCGANRRRHRLALRKAGSSPRVRGKLLELFLQLGPVRIIPACAGQTVSSLSA